MPKDYDHLFNRVMVLATSIVVTNQSLHDELERREAFTDYERGCAVGGIRLTRAMYNYLVELFPEISQDVVTQRGGDA